MAEPSGDGPGPQDASPRYERGLDMRRKVLGREYVDAAITAGDDYSRQIQELVTEYAWGAIWAREGLDPRTRSLITIAMLAGLGQPNELRLHIQGAITNGCTPIEVRETLLHAAIYLGVPAALSCLAVAREVLAADTP